MNENTKNGEQARKLTPEEYMMSKAEYRLHLLREAADCVKIMEDLDEFISDEERLYPILRDEIEEWQSDLDEGIGS